MALYTPAVIASILVTLSLAFATPLPTLELRGAWHPDTYVLKDGTRLTVDGLIVFTERDWIVVFLVAPDGRTPKRGSGEAGTYTLTGDRLVFSHRYNLSGGDAVKGLPADPFEMNLHDAAAAPTEACTAEVVAGSLTIRFPSGNTMAFVRASP